MMRSALFACLLLFLACAAVGNAHPAATARHLPLLDGGFWQVGPGLSGKMTDAQLAEEVTHMKNLGM
ncbi:MAG: hypothetical protein PWP23_2320, partial [Candidatus Sumerlaeota bacterium]|nr:hypothetical protein [Candidatus Sumerlaeota bacterium]